MAEYFLSTGPHEDMLGPFDEKELTAWQGKADLLCGRFRLVRRIHVGRRIEPKEGMVETFYECEFVPSPRPRGFKAKGRKVFVALLALAGLAAVVVGLFALL